MEVIDSITLFLEQKDHPAIQCEQYLKLLENIQDPTEKIEKAKFNYIKSNLLLKMNDLRRAEEFISKALKFDSKEALYWEIMSDILYRKKDFTGCKNCLENSIQRNMKNPRTLRHLSIILRCIGKNEERQQNVEKSVEVAKQALNLNLKDGESWYIMGNAYMTNFYTNQKTIQELNLALKSYKKAKMYLSEPIPDLHYNMGTILNYLQEYQSAYLEYEIAENLGINLDVAQIKQSILQKNEFIYRQISTNCNQNSKRLQAITKTIQTTYENQNKVKAVNTFDQLRPGINQGIIFKKGFLVSCKVMQVVNQNEHVPAIFIVIDHLKNFITLSIYNAGASIYESIKEKSEIQIISPILKNIQFIRQEETISYQCIQLFDIKNILVNKNKIIDNYAPSIVQNTSLDI